MPRFFGMFTAIALACVGFSHTAEAMQVAKSLTSHEGPPQKGRGNASARRAAQKQRQKQKAKQIGRRRR